MKTLTLVFLLFTLSCGTMRLQVKSNYKTSQETGVVIFEKSYPVGGAMPLWCGLTVIFYGGACWAYLGMPFVPQEERFLKEAAQAINREKGVSDAELVGPVVDRISWSSAEEYLALSE